MPSDVQPVSVGFTPGPYSCVILPMKRRNLSALAIKNEDINIGRVIAMGNANKDEPETYHDADVGDYVYFRPYEGEPLPFVYTEGKQALLVPKVAIFGIYSSEVGNLLTTADEEKPTNGKQP